MDMIIYSVGDEYTGESKFYRSRRAALAAARSQAKHHGHCCYVDRHEIGASKADLLRFLNYIPVERITSDLAIEPPKEIKWP